MNKNTICLCYFILTIKYKNIYCGEDEICIRYKNKWIAKMKYNEITEYGELYFHGEYIAAKKSLHYKRGEQEDRVYNFYLNKENRAILRNLIKSKAKYVQKMLC